MNRRECRYYNTKSRENENMCTGKYITRKRVYIYIKKNDKFTKTTIYNEKHKAA